MLRASIHAAVAMFVGASAAATVTLDDFHAVHKARLEREGRNVVRVRFPSAEWGSGIKWESGAGEDLSRGR